MPNRSVYLCEHKLVCLVGPAELRAAYRKGLQASAEQIHEAESADCLESIIASFSGCIFCGQSCLCPGTTFSYNI